MVDANGEHYPDCDRAASFCGLGANGGDGFAMPAGTCSLMYPVIFFAIFTLVSSLAVQTNAEALSRKVSNCLEAGAPTRDAEGSEGGRHGSESHDVDRARFATRRPALAISSTEAPDRLATAAFCSVAL